MEGEAGFSFCGSWIKVGCLHILPEKGVSDVYRIALCMVSILLVAGCQNDKPKPNSSPNPPQSEHRKSVESSALLQDRTLTVHQYVSGDDVYVECIINRFTFQQSSQNQDGQGYVVVYVDGVRTLEESKAAFVIPNLEKGVHRIRLEVEREKGSVYDLKQEFSVNVGN